MSHDDGDSGEERGDIEAHRFEGKTALVTGSTRGIGAGTARRLAAEGADVVVTGRTVADGEAVADRISEETPSEAHFVPADMRDPAAIEALVEATVERFGGLDVLVNSAGVQTETAADDATMDDWAFVLETDFRSYWLTTKHAVAAMDDDSGGAVVNVSSNHARQTMPEHFPYNAVKAGIDGMTRAMALDFGPAIRVNTVNPGWVAVERTVSGMDDDYREHLESIHPVGRLGEPSDVAAAVAFLASDAAGFVTGASLLVDGGRSAVMQDDTLPDYRDRRA